MARREVPPAKTRRALAKLKRAVDAVEKTGGKVELTSWEREFTETLAERLKTYGSAFTDPGKGALDEALSMRQAAKLREVAKKSRKPAKGPARRTGLKRSTRLGRPRPPARVRDVDEDMGPEPPAAPSLTVIDGGREGEDG